MSKQVLVLNASYEPLSLVSVRRAIVLLLREKAELLEATQYMLRSHRQKMPVPLVIRLVHFVRLPHRKVPSTRSAVMLRDAYTCQYCGETPGRQFLTVDHVIPRSRGGTHEWENLVTACTRCNQKKGSLTPEEASMHLVRKPFEPTYVALVLLSNPVAAQRWEHLMDLTRRTGKKPFCATLIVTVHYMPTYDARKETIDAILRRIADLNEQSLTQLAQYISYLKWQEELWHSLLDEEAQPGPNQTMIWQYDFLEGFPVARKVSTRSPDLMEIKVGLAACGMVQQMALWEHPPVIGSAVCEYQLHVPPEVESLRLRFAVGIRDGALMEGENWCAFRIYVNGVRLWSTTKQSNEWERFLIDVPSLGGQDIVVQFVTDGLGDNRWNWAVWAEPQLLGYGERKVTRTTKKRALG